MLNATGSLIRRPLEATPAAGEGIPGNNQAMKTLRLLMVDDHMILREGLRALLELQPDSPWSAKRVILSAPWNSRLSCSRISCSPISACRAARGSCWCGSCARFVPAARIVLLTAHCSEEYIRAGLDAWPMATCSRTAAMPSSPPRSAPWRPGSISCARRLPPRCCRPTSIGVRSASSRIRCSRSPRASGSS